MKKQFLYNLRNGTSTCFSYLQSPRVSDTLSVAGIRLRRWLAPVLRLVYRTQTPYKIVMDSKIPLPPNRLGRIFAINHRQGDDIVIGANAVGRSGYIVFGNEHLAFETRNGLGLWAYGMILLDRDSRESRRATYQKMKFVIEHGGNIIIYPEGYWNLADDGEADVCHPADSHNSENWLVQDLNVGIFRLAKETGCEIVPTLLQYNDDGEKVCYASRGAPFTVAPWQDEFQRKDEFLQIMWTMMWELIKKHSGCCRGKLESQGICLKEEWVRLQEELRSACDIPQTGYRLDLADEKRIGKARVVAPVTTPREAFAHLDHLIPCRENAFLFRQR